jgi:hypothetical protein
MSTSAPLEPNSPDTPPSPDATVPVPDTFEDTLRRFWEKNSRTIYGLCLLVLLVIVGKGVYEYFQHEREKGIAADYAAALGTSDKLRSFASTHPKHQLAGAAHLTLADEAYSAAKYTDAAAAYQKAAEILKPGVFAGRAHVGLGISKVLGGQTADGEQKLKQVADDKNQPKNFRAEAAYHVGTIAAESGRTDEAIKFFDLAASVEPASLWAQRSLMQRATLAPAAPADAPATPPAAPKP